ncbi:MAG: hypothetical protein ABEH38_04045 [Flavobacteriales bacterium]
MKRHGWDKTTCQMTDSLEIDHSIACSRKKGGSRSIGEHGILGVRGRAV